MNLATKRLALAFLLAGTAACGTDSVGTDPSSSAVSCATWAGQQRGSGVPAAPTSVASYRQSVYSAGGGIRALGSKYFVAWFPPNYDAASTKRVMIALHGIDGSPEAEWVLDWGAQMQSHGWGFLGLSYLDNATGSYDTDVTIYAQIKAMVDDVKANCAFGSPKIFLAGFSRGSAESFPVAYLDNKDRKLITATLDNSGAWIIGQPMPPTLQGIVTRNETTAFAGVKFWMYCGERDQTHGYPMCDEMVNAQTFVAGRGATVLTLFRDPTGGHGGINMNATALAQLFAAFEGL